jgi:tripeptide aminopeptidase
MDAAVLAAAARYTEQVEAIAELSVAVQQIPAPTGNEERRAAWIAHRWQQAGFADVEVDGEQNVYTRIVGKARRPALLVSAHTDTVFGHDVDLQVRHDREGGRVHGPGIGDNSTGVAALLTLADSLTTLSIPPVDIWLVANSREEGLGDLAGMRAAVERLAPDLGAAIVIEGMGLGRIVHRGLGSRRYRISVDAPGGHSWSDFGSASALHVIALLAADLARLRVPESPRTTFNIGRLMGGTSVNTIAQQAWLELDLRSEETGALHRLLDQVMAIVAIYQAAKWQRRGVQVRAEVIGDRPPGEIPATHPLVVAANATLAAVGYGGATDLRISSTDANIPLSRGIPAVCIGVTDGGNAHRVEEWMQVAPLAKGMAHLLLLTHWAAGWLGRSAA